MIRYLASRIGRMDDASMRRVPFRDRLPGGLADRKRPSDFKRSALVRGTRVEREHTHDDALAREIAMDHLVEDPAYYRKLARMEHRRYNPPKGCLVLWGVSAKARPRQNPGSKLSPDQEQALSTILAKLSTGQRVTLVLAGPAGTGKTTLMRALIDRLKALGVGIVLLAPTGKAAARLKEATGLPTATIHSFIYSAPATFGICKACKQGSAELGQTPSALSRLGIEAVACPSCQEEYTLQDLRQLKKEMRFSGRELAADKRTVVIVDEASMVDDKVGMDLARTLPSNFSVLYVGDKEQLPPVSGRWGADFEHPTAELTQVHRQAADNPIVDMATRIRKDENRDDPFAFNVALDAHLPPSQRRIVVLRDRTFAEVSTWMAGGRRAGRDGVVIANANKDRVEINKQVRTLLGHPQIAQDFFENKQRRFLPWKTFGGASVLKGDYPVAGDKLLVMSNNRAVDIYNGEVFEVERSRLPVHDEMIEMGLVFVKLKGKEQEFLVRVNYLNDTDTTTKIQGIGDDFRFFVRELSKAAQRMAELDEDGVPVDPDAFLAVQELSAEDLFEQFGTIRSADFLLVDYGEAITAHKSQGSQWDTVGVIWRSYQREMWRSGGERYEYTRRWLYTAITRAKTRVVIWEIP